MERIGQSWFCVLDVPAALAPAIGTKRFRMTLGTASLPEARTRRHAILAEFHAALTDARQGRPRRPRKVEFFDNAGPETTTARALMWREGLSAARQQGDEAAADGVESAITDEAERLEARAGLDAAQHFVAVAEGRATPLALVMAAFKAEAAYPARTKRDIERTAERLEVWAAKVGRVIAVETFSKRDAGLFISEALMGQGVQPRTMAKAVSSLSSVWRFAAGKGYVEDGRNPWLGQAKPRTKAHREDANERERPFHDDEVSKLLAGPADRVLADLMRMAALTGARLEEMFTLRVRDCRLAPGAETIFIPKGKTASATRHVPIHPALLPVITRRCEGKGATDFLFHEEGSKGPGGERSMAVSKRFGYYLRRLNLDVMVPGKRRSLTNFHSFRRWFITKAMQANQTKEVIGDVVGHRRQGMTMGVYAGDTLASQKRACVEAVRLP